MNTMLSTSRSRLLLPLIAVAFLGGCAVYDDPYYARPAYSSSVYVAPAPVYVGPSTHFGVHYRSDYPYRAPAYRPPPRHVHPRPPGAWGPPHHHHPRPPGHWR